MSAPWRRLAAVALIVAAVPVLLPSSGTTARWREQSSVALPDAELGLFEASAQDITNGVDHTAGSDLANEPAIRITNQSRQRAWIDVTDLTASVPASNTGSTLLSHVDVDVDDTPGTDCTSGLPSGSLYWDVNGSAPLTAAQRYDRTPARVSSAVLEPAASGVLCPFVRPDYDTSTAAGRAAFLREQAGRQLDLAVRVRQQSESPATWSSTTRTVTTRYQVQAPAPVQRSGETTACYRTDGFGNRVSYGAWTTIYWAWPDSTGSSATATPAVDRFVLLRSVDDGQTWKEFRRSNNQVSGTVYSVAGSARQSPEVNSHYINDSDGLFGTGDWRWFSVRAYLYPGSDVYVDAAFMVQMRMSGSHGECGAQLPNPTAGPHGL